MPALDPKRLIDLLRIAEHGSYTRAAAALGVSQPALSAGIAALEKTLGVRVLERTRHGARLTEAGRLLASHAEALDTLLSRAVAELALRKRGMEGSLVVGVSPIACVDLVPDAVARLTHETPAVSVLLHERADDQLLADLRSGEIDAMVGPAGLAADPPDIKREVLLRDSFVVILRREHPLAWRRALSLAQLRDGLWIMPDAHTTMWHQIEAIFAAENEPWPMRSVATNSITALKSLVMRTDGASIFSRRLVQREIDAGYLAGVPLRKPPVTREICLRLRRQANRPPLVERFAEALRAVAEGLRRAEGRSGR
jgi:molybdate transport repressor ModE-like protein